MPLSKKMFGQKISVEEGTILGTNPSQIWMTLHEYFMSFCQKIFFYKSGQ